MKRNHCLLLALSALVIMTGGCKKNSPASLDVGTNAKAGWPSSPSWTGLAKTSRLIRFDINDGNWSSCLLSYDISSNKVVMTQVIGGNGTNIFSSTTGLPLVGGGFLRLNTYLLDCTDDYNEVGGDHLIAYDAGGTGHETYLIRYVPGRGIFQLLSYNPTAKAFSIVVSYTTGVAGYDLKGYYDKITTYDYGSGSKNAFVIYRPLSGFVWIIQNTGSGLSPNFTAEVKGSSGIGGFDLKGATDQIVAVDYNPGAMDLCCYRPEYGYVYYLTHTAYSTTWTASYYTHSGLFNFSFADQQDRMIPFNDNGSTAVNADNSIFCYRPGGGMSPTVVDGISGVSVTGGPPYPGLSVYPMSTNPYLYPDTYIGDHVLNFSGNAEGNSSVVCYTNGGSTAPEIFELNNTASAYTQVY